MPYRVLFAAIGANADMTVSADIATDGKKTLTRGLRKYGDKFNRVALFVMHSTTYFDIVDQAIDNKIYEEAGVVVYGGQPGTLGKPVLVTDTMPVDAILGLVAGAVSGNGITGSGLPFLRYQRPGKTLPLAIAQRVRLTLNCWVTAGMRRRALNPDLTKIGTGANWKKHFTSNKSTAGVLIKLEAPAEGVTLSVDKTSATADSTDAVTVSLKYTRNGAGVSRASVAWTSTGGTLSASTSQTGSAGGSTVKLTSATAGSFTLTATVDGVVKTTEAIAFTAPAGWFNRRGESPVSFGEDPMTVYITIQDVDELLGIPGLPPTKRLKPCSRQTPG